jgi:anthraniloyl-CoA monooxygenase
VVAVTGGSYVTRILLAEESRMARKIPSLLVDDNLGADEAATLVLSGRTDLVGAAPDIAAGWSEP